ncbi:MAG: hypothetical protein WCW47_00965 [Candidatus Paceibacterota bacterium]|jgi:hypothetical protein
MVTQISLHGFWPLSFAIATLSAIGTLYGIWGLSMWWRGKVSFIVAAASTGLVCYNINPITLKLYSQAQAELGTFWLWVLYATSIALWATSVLTVLILRMFVIDMWGDWRRYRARRQSA